LQSYGETKNHNITNKLINLKRKHFTPSGTNLPVGAKDASKTASRHMGCHSERKNNVRVTAIYFFFNFYH